MYEVLAIATYFIPLLYFWDFKHDPKKGLIVVLAFYATLLVLLPFFVHIGVVFLIPAFIFISIVIAGRLKKKTDNSGDILDVFEED